MENFRPPSMDAVEKKRAKNKIVFSIIIFFIILSALGLFHFGYHFFTQSHHKKDFNQKSLIVKKYLDALIVNDAEVLSTIFPEYSNYSDELKLQNVENSYTLYVYPKDINKDTALLFQIINHPTDKTFLFEVIFGKTNNQIYIESTTTLNTGTKISIN